MSDASTIDGHAPTSLQHLAMTALRSALVLVFLAFGYVKFFPFEAEGLVPLLQTSPLLSWMHDAFGIQGASYALGVSEITTAILLATRPFSARLSAVGGLMAIATFLLTLSLMLSTPGVWEESAGGFPAISAALGGFLMKDFVLLAASFTLFADSLAGSRRTAH